jgi:ATP-dependent DNA helicase PIF1
MSELAVAEEPVFALDPAIEPVFQFLTGVAGCGKTYLIRERAENYDDAVLCTTTGISAVNLGAGAVTINSLLMYYTTEDLRSSYEVGRLGAFLKRLVESGYTRIVCDEISMMPAEQLTILVTAIEDLNRWYVEHDRPTLGLTIVGDFLQLGPVNAPYAFESPCWDRFEDHTIVLRKQWRQTNPDFITALHAVRRGDRRLALDYFGSRIQAAQESNFNGTTLFAKNDEVDRHNKLRLLQLLAKSDFYEVKRVGKQASEWLKQIPDRLELKPGCLVMILANRRHAKENPSDPPAPLIYCNGDLGTYLGRVSERTARVKLLRNGQEVNVESITREKGSATGSKGVKMPRQTVEGSITYLPLRIGYGSTVHKSQSLSLDNVQVVFHSQFFTSPFMLYVAMSRARTPEGLRLVGQVKQFESRIVTHPKVMQWA